MRDKFNSPKSTNRKARVIRSMSNAGRAGDARSQKLGFMGKKLGNDGLGTKMKGADQKADSLLAFIGGRLKTLHGIQDQELREMGDERQWQRRVAMGKAGFHLLDATRYHESAQLYKKAAQAICSGNLGRGANLLEQAMEAERSVLESMPAQVQENLRDEEKRPDEAPVELGHVSEGALCTSRALPKDIEWADRILAVQERMEASTPIGLYHMQMWFEHAREREEEEDDDDG